MSGPGSLKRGLSTSNSDQPTKKQAVMTNKMVVEVARDAGQPQAVKNEQYAVTSLTHFGAKKKKKKLKRLPQKLTHHLPEFGPLPCPRRFLLGFNIC